MRLDNPLKERLQAGEAVVGCFVPMPSPEVVEILAVAGFGWVLFDAEHGRVSPENVYPMILAAEARGVPTVARVGQNDRQVINKFLDLGIGGVMIPQTNSLAACEEAVAAMRYHPRGVRGLAGGRTFAYGLGEAAVELVPKLNERVLSTVQFEHIGAMAELERVLAIPGLDVLFVGPNDLAQSMGFPGQPGHPEVEAAIERVVATAQGSGVALGTVAADAAAVEHRLGQGFRMIGANAATLLARAGRDLLAAVGR